MKKIIDLTLNAIRFIVTFVLGGLLFGLPLILLAITFHFSNDSNHLLWALILGFVVIYIVGHLKNSIPNISNTSTINEHENKINSKTKNNQPSNDISIEELEKFGIYYSDQGDFKKAILYFTEAANLNSSEAQFRLSRLYFDELNDPISALPWLIKSANNNHVHAQYILALCYLNGIPMTKDLHLAKVWIIRAEQNCKYKTGKLYAKIQKYIVKIYEEYNNENAENIKDDFETTAEEKKRIECPSCNTAIQIPTLEQSKIEKIICHECQSQISIRLDKYENLHVKIINKTEQHNDEIKSRADALNILHLDEEANTQNIKIAYKRLIGKILRS